MMPETLTPEECRQLLQTARHAIQAGIQGKPFQIADRSIMPPRLLQPGAAFVTLTEADKLRGCVGALEAYQPLVDDVCEHALAAAFGDYRFEPLSADEEPFLNIEISVLTPLQPLAYKDDVELLCLLRPGVDGVLIMDGSYRATFLPQVWEKINNPADFLSQLCLKMGAPSNLWRCKHLQVFVYQVEEFHE